MYLPHLAFSVTISPFHWLRLEAKRTWAAAWITIGPVDIGVNWGG